MEGRRCEERTSGSEEGCLGGLKAELMGGARLYLGVQP